MAGPGESFGERALLTEPAAQHDGRGRDRRWTLWTLSKPDFDMLMNRYPSLAISMSRLLSQRLSRQPASMQPSVLGRGAPPSRPTSRRSQRRRRVQSGAAGRRRRRSGTATPRQGFGAWYGRLSGFGKVRFALLVLLLLLLLGCTIPFTIITIINGPAAAGRAAMSTLNRALNVVYAKGTYEVASADGTLASALLAADAEVPPTPTYTPFPTDTPTARTYGAAHRIRRHPCPRQPPRGFCRRARVCG